MNNPLAGIRVDFVKGAVGFRQKRSSLKSELLSKAVGAKKGLKILDATAGLGTDAFILAFLGYEVTAVEKDSKIFELLKDGYQRALENSHTREAALRLQILNQDSLEFLKMSSHFDAIYLDPMFPEKTKSALPKKEMQILQRHLAHQEAMPADVFLKMILESSKAKRVVIKRPKEAGILLSQPAAQFKGKSVRFDVYVSDKHL